MSETSYNRTPVVIAEIVQPRCSNRFGTAPCTATGTPKCFQTYWTCRDLENFNTDGSITWRFSRPGDDVGWLYDQDDSNTIRTNAIPILESATTTSSRINPGASREGESPLGRRATARLVFRNAPWDDHVGDFYKSDRNEPETKPGFWDVFTRRNPFYPDFEVRVYEGYAGQSLSEMQVRVFDLESISGPDANDRYTVSCRDPLDRIRGKNALYPPTSEMDLVESIDSTTTTIVVSSESCTEANLGNTSTRYIAIGDEIISYTGCTGSEPNITLTGVRRGQAGTTAENHDADAAVQRVAHHKDQLLYEVAKYILQDHTTVPNGYIDDAQWEEEGNTYLSSLRCNTFLAEPVPVEELLGELCRDGLFSLWWDDRKQKIPLLAVRPPRGIPILLSDDNNIAGFSKRLEFDDRMTRVSIFFSPRNPISDLEDGKNYRNRRIRIDDEVELPTAAGGKIFDNVIYSRWTQTFANALLVGASLLLRYRLPPEYLTLELDAKDRDIEVGDVVDLSTRHVVDVEGNPLTSRWQVIAQKDTAQGSRVQVELQSFNFIGRFAFIMANDAPDFASATDDEKQSGCWIAENTGLMPDGTEPYLLQ